MRLLPLLIACLITIASGLPAWADDHEPEKSESAPEARQSTTEHRIRIGGQNVDYSATVGWLIMHKDDKPVARFGYTAYLRQGDHSAA